MALAEMVQELNGYIDHNPDLAVYRNRVISEINAAYMEFSTEKSWLFLHKTTQFASIAPVTGSTSATVSVTNGAYTVTVTGTSPSTSWEGHIFYGPDGREYEIARVTSVGGGDILILMTRYEGSTVVASSSWQILFTQYALPVDAQEAVSFFDLSTRVRLPFISRGRDEALGFNRLSSGGPMVAVDTIQRTDRAPDYAPTVAAAAGGSLAASNTYEVCYTFTMAGRESPPSPAASVTTSGVNKTINVSGLENMADVGDDTGIWKKIYLRNVTLKDRWLCVNPARADQIGTTTTTTTISSLTAFSHRESNELMPSEPWRQYVRFDPPMSDARFIEVRYKQKVRPLAADSDVPLIPGEFERIIIFRALRRMCLSIGATQLWQAWASESDRLERACAAVHLARGPVGERRRAIRMPGDASIDPRFLGTYTLS